VRDVELAAGVEAPEALSVLAADEPVGGDDRLAPRLGVIDDEKVVADVVEIVEVAPEPRHAVVGPGAHLVVEDAVAERLGGVDLADAFGEADTQIAGAQVDDPARRGCRLTLERAPGSIDHPPSPPQSFVFFSSGTA